MNQIQELLDRNNLPHNSVYLLELIPLIEMIWADGKTQEKEVTILQDFTIRHLANLSKDADGMEVVTVEEANEFIDYFLNQRPSKQLLSDLKSLSVEQVRQTNNRDRRQVIIDYCMDIAGACVVEYPYLPSERIRTEEKELIREIVTQLSLDHD
jgi:hypothetical protein